MRGHSALSLLLVLRVFYRQIRRELFCDQLFGFRELLDRHYQNLLLEGEIWTERRGVAGRNHWNLDQFRKQNLHILPHPLVR